MKEDIEEGLLIRYILGEADTQERGQVEAWLQRGDAHVKHFEQTKFLLDKSKELAKASPLTEEDAWEKFKIKRAHSKPAPVRTLNRWLQAAAAVLLITAGGWAAWYYTHPQPNQWATLTAYEKVVTDTLPDGSVIQLNKHASISYSGRTVRLKGEAFFNVVHNAGKPFVVHTGDISITDIGTAFNVKSGGGQVEVIVESGIVRVSKKDKSKAGKKDTSVILKQQQSVLINPGDTSLQIKSNPDILYQYYRTGRFVADKTPLSRLVQVLSEAYGVDIQIKDTSLAGQLITGDFKKTESVHTILQIFQLAIPEMRIINQGDQIILTR